MQMFRVILLICAGLALAGCGADGEPIQPTMSANVGVGTSGAYGGVGLGLRRGGLGVYLGL